MKTKSKDYYSILGVSENENPDEIKKAFRKRAMELHPDRNPNDSECEEKFKGAAEAYGVLIDPVKRAEYDRHRAGLFTETTSDDYDFRYSQQDIFENMFRKGFGRDIFEELNREFSRRGFRSGQNFFAAILFGGAAGKLGQLLRFIPGPIGRLGVGLRILQVVGTSLYTLNAMRKARAKPVQEGQSKERSVKNSIKGFFGKSKETGAGDKDIKFQISIPEAEAVSGTQKQISYNVNKEKENLLITIPPGTKSGSQLRIKEKGKIRNGHRGDLILTVNFDS